MKKQKETSPPLTEAEWERVFMARCRSKRGCRLTDDEQGLIEQAWVADRRRYRAMAQDVFDATVPFGSTRKWRA